MPTPSHLHIVASNDFSLIDPPRRAAGLRPGAAFARRAAPRRLEAREDSPVRDIGWYEAQGERQADRRALRLNLLAAVVIIVLMMVGGWVMTTMEEVQGDPDCALGDRTNCPVYVPHLSTRQLNSPDPFL